MAMLDVAMSRGKILRTTINSRDVEKNAAANHVALFLYATIELHCAVVNCARYPLRMLPERYFRKQGIRATAHAPPKNGQC